MLYKAVLSKNISRNFRYLNVEKENNFLNNIVSTMKFVRHWEQ